SGWGWSGGPARRAPRPRGGSGRRGSWCRRCRRPARGPGDAAAPVSYAHLERMGPNAGRVEDQPLQVGILQCLEELLAAPLARPAVEAPPHRVPVAKAFGQVAPGCPGLGDPPHGVDEQSVVLGSYPALPGPTGQQILDALPILVADYMAM